MGLLSAHVDFGCVTGFLGSVRLLFDVAENGTYDRAYH